VTAPEISHAGERAIDRAPCVIFAYHQMGHDCLAALLAMGAPVAALFTHYDSPGEEIWWDSCAALARRNSIPVHRPEKLDRGWIDRVVARQPAIIYSFYYRYLIPGALLQTAPLGAYNLHGSLLPHYRGRAPVNWMIANGEREAGVTLHHMVARADAGDIVAQRAIAIADNDTALTLYRKLVPLGVELIREFHPLIVAGRAPRRAQDLAQGSYYGRRGPEDGRIDWRWPARRIVNLVRAVTHPYPGAFCFIAGRKLLIWQAGIAAESGNRAVAGAVLGAGEGGVQVAAGEGVVLLKRIQFEGETEQAAEALIGRAADEPRPRLD
jgi:UDP-4-amino-4-deoxy-L-arabinose formyltransferase / UDP-glucuronic acid dehydrogenase (UDP-4-keto-hexauronic acid decarboxylating)